MVQRLKVFLPWILFGITLATTTFVGAQLQGVNLLTRPGAFAVGLPYALGLLGILCCHELGHYFAAKRYGVSVSRPFFIPVPFGMGTFGAVIDMKEDPPSRRALFDVAVAGPLAGLIVAIPLFIVGLHFSSAAPHSNLFLNSVSDPATGQTPALFAVLSNMMVGSPLHQGHIVALGALAHAGWLGIWLTALNLLPIGQLDGGHIARAMFGHGPAAEIGEWCIYSLLLIAFLMLPGLRAWALILAICSGQVSGPLRNERRISWKRKLLGYGTFAIMLAVLIPVSHLH